MLDICTLDDFKNKIEEAECILIGSGDELSILKFNTYDFDLDNFKATCEDKEVYHWFLNLLRVKLAKDRMGHENIYNKLAKLIENKNYFVISTCVDELLIHSNLKQDRIVMPCGNVELFQCSNACTKEAWKDEEYLNRLLNEFNSIVSIVIGGNYSELRKYMSLCKNCGSIISFNVRYNPKNYVEEGYINQWNLYSKWLQGTLNKKILILELGENFDLPNLIRWPFEKIAFYNNKATFIRINEKNWQISDEIRDKAITIKENASILLSNL